MLRIIVNLGGAKEFIDKENFIRRDSIAYFLDIGKYVEMYREDFKRSEPLAIY